MNRLALVIVTALVASTAIASDTDQDAELVIGKAIEIVLSNMYRSYECHDRYTSSEDPYIFIRIGWGTVERDGTDPNLAFVRISDTTYIGAAYQQGLDYRVDFGELTSDANYAILIQNDGLSDFYDFTDAPEGEGQAPERRLTCEKVMSIDSPPVDSEELAEYMTAIRQKIERNWSPPASADAELDCSVRVRQIPGGEVVGVTILSCNGDDAVRRSVEAAIYRSSPLPEPSDPYLFDKNILLNLSIH